MAQEVVSVMGNDNKSRERSLDTVRRWYHGHAEEYNEKRREKYAIDKPARDRARERAKDYRERRRKGNGLSDEPLFRFIDKNGPCPYGHGKRILVWTTGQIAYEIGATPQMLRTWEKKGWIPDSIFPDKHRLYTSAQRNLIVELAEFMKTYRKSPSKYKKHLQLEVALIKKVWSNL